MMARHAALAFITRSQSDGEQLAGRALASKVASSTER
jgi:hypothetical protein